MRTWVQVGQIVKERRQELQLTQKQAVEAAGEGLSLPTIQTIEGGRATGMRSRTKAALARALQWPPTAVDYLLKGDDPKDWIRQELPNGGTHWRRPAGDGRSTPMGGQLPSEQDYQIDRDIRDVDERSEAAAVLRAIQRYGAPDSDRVKAGYATIEDKIAMLAVDMAVIRHRLNALELRATAELAVTAAKKALDDLTERAEAVGQALPPADAAPPVPSAPRGRTRRPRAAAAGDRAP
jgi:transcriptional regulator with XRE-family HTH domain